MTRHLLLSAVTLLSVLVTRTAVAAGRAVDVIGRLEVIQVDDFAGGRGRVLYRLRDALSGDVYKLKLPRGPHALRTGMMIRVRGEMAGTHGRRARLLAASGEAGSVQVLAAPAVATGPRKAIVLVVDFLQDAKTVACSDAAIAATMFTGNPSVDKLYQQTSFGNVSWPADTDGNGQPDVLRVQINDAGNDCDDATWRSEADSAATAAGANLALYQHRVYVLPSSVACGWAGYALIGCGSSCWAMVDTCDRGDVFAHELGHNLGMWHSSFDADDDGAVDATCPWGGWPGGGEYCDDSDVMGISTNVWRQVNGPHKNEMGWIPTAKVLDVSQGGTYQVAPLETDPATTTLPLLLRVPRASGSPYYLSYRRALGYDTTMRASYTDHTSVHTAPGGNTLMVTFLADTQTFTDTANGITVTQTAHDAASATVVVTRTCGNGILDPGEECDGANLNGATCTGCAGQPRCTSGCRLDYSSCTNGVCDSTETCTSCAQDCVGSGARCGDGICQAGNGENCVTCPADCHGVQSGKPAARYCCGNSGYNPIGCDPNRCGACDTQTFSVCCGDGVCNGSETAANCPRDCSSTCTDADGDGYCVQQGDCNDANPNVHPGATELCTGGVDENCNGLTDCADPACATSPACTTCLASGASCTDNSQCCSGSCGGKPRRKTCR